MEIIGGKKATSECLVGDGWPPPSRQSEVAFGGTQKMNSNSNSASQDPFQFYTHGSTRDWDASNRYIHLENGIMLVRHDKIMPLIGTSFDHLKLHWVLAYNEFSYN